MRGDEAALVAPERMLQRQGLGIGHVKGRAAQMTFRKHAGKGIAVYEIAADGKTVCTGKVPPIDVDPHQEAEVDLGYRIPAEGDIVDVTEAPKPEETRDCFLSCGADREESPAGEDHDPGEPAEDLRHEDHAEVHPGGEHRV